MKKATKKQSTKESVTSRQLWGTPKESQTERAAEKELPDEELNVGQDVLAVIDALPFYVLLIDANYYILQANQVARQRLGLETEDIIGKYYPKAIHGLDEPFYACPLEEAVDKDQPVEIEVFDTESGHWVNSAIYPTQGVTRGGKRIYFHMVIDITDRKLTEERVRASRDQLRSLSAHLESVREEERKKIAHDLHDETSQVIASLTALLEAAVSKLPAGADQSMVLLNKAQDLSIQILDQIHKLIYQLRPTIIDDLGLPAAIRWLVESNLEVAGLKVNLKVIGQEKRLTPGLETALFRVMQEAIGNIVRHAHAQNVNIRLYFRKRNVKLRVRDDGCGFDVNEAITSKDRPRGLGLLGMKERIGLVNGTVNISSCSGGGTEIDIEIPFNCEVSSEQD